MNRGEFVQHLVRGGKFSSAREAAEVFGKICSGIAECLEKPGDKVPLTGVGILRVARRKARTGRNPRTGEPVEISEGNVIRFQQGSRSKANMSVG